MSRPLKVLACHNYYTEGGGEEYVFNSEVAGLRQSGHEVVVYSRQNTDIAGWGTRRAITRMPELIRSPRTRREITAIVADTRPDIAIIQNVFPLISPVIYETLHRLGVPIIQSIFNYRFMCTNAHLYTHGSICEKCVGGNHLHGVVRRCYQNSAVKSLLLGGTLMYHRAIGTFTKCINIFMVPDQFMADKLIESGIPAAKIRINVNPFIMNSDHSPPADHQGYLVFVGRLIKAKGILTLLQALKQTRTAPRVVVVGFGPLEHAVRAMAAELGPARLDFKGALWEQTMQGVVAGAKAVLVPSEWYDNLPLALCEANALGRPVIASRINGITEYIEVGKNGWLVEPGDPAKLAGMIDQMHLLPDAEWHDLSVGARQVAEARFDYPNHYRVLLASMEELTESSDGKRKCPT